MSVLDIVTVERDAAALRSKADPVERVDGGVRALLDDMVDTMRDAPGVGLAAPQIGVGLRLIVVEAARPSDDEGEREVVRLHRLANPEIVWASEERAEGQEACLSIPGLFGDVMRHVAIRVRAIDDSGRTADIEAEGFEARVFQHEIDHLDGVLFTDRVESFQKLYHVEEDADGDLVRVPYRPPAIVTFDDAVDQPVR